MVNLADAACIRMSELSRLLAGLACLAPVEVIPLVQTLKPDDLLDEHARQFLGELFWGEWTIANALDTVSKLNLWPDYWRWQYLVESSGDGFETIGARTTEAIKRIHITLLTVQDLAQYAADLEKGKR